MMPLSGIVFWIQALSLLPHLGLCHMSSQGILGDSGIVVAQCHCDVTR